MMRFLYANCQLALTGLLFFLLTTELLAEAELRGRVTDADTGASLQTALVTVDPDIATLDDELTTLTGPWGFYSLSGLAAGTYEVTASHPGYTPETVEKTLSDGDLVMEDFALEPLVPGQTLITVYGHVVDTKSSLELPKVPVRIRRYNSENASDPAETFVKVTDGFGMVEFNGLPTGWYDFRFNATENDTDMARPFWEPLVIGRRLLNTTHSANARLMPISQDVTIMVEGPDPAMPGEPKGLAGVNVVLTGIRPDFDKNVPPGFDPATDLFSNYVIPVLPARSGVTDKDGNVVFKNLPAIPFMVQITKYGYKRWEEPFTPDSDTGEFESPRTFFIDLVPTTLKVALESFYEDFLFPDGIPVLLHGLSGTNTEGIRREAPAFFVPFGPPPLIPLPTATFDGLLPGRYLVTVNHDKASPPVPAADFTTTYTIGYEAEVYVDIPVEDLTVEFLHLRVIPATIRGRLWVAEEVGTLERGDSSWGEESPEYLGPIYRPKKQDGIELAETILSSHLPEEFRVHSVDADEDGNFVAKVFPGVYTARIPSMDGYMGSNYELIDFVDGERFSLGWPYDPPDLLAPPFIPIPPLGSFGMIINSRGDYELNLYVRKQLWYLSADVTADIADHPALHRIVTSKTEPPITVAFSDLGKGGEMMLELEEGGALVEPLVNKISGKPGDSRFPASAARFSFAVGPGLHTLSGAHPNHTIAHPDSGETVFAIPLPNLEYPGFLSDTFILPLREVWGGLPGLPDTLKGNYSGTTGLSIEFYDDLADESPVIAFNKPDIFTFPGHGSKQFLVGIEPFKMVPGSYTIWKKYLDKWYTTTFSPGIEDPKIIKFDIIEGPGMGSPPPELTYTLTVTAVSDADPTHSIPGLLVEMTDTEVFVTPETMTGYGGAFIPAKVLNTEK